MGLCFAIFVFLTFRGPLASHDSNPYPNHSRIARYNATKHVGIAMVVSLVEASVAGRLAQMARVASAAWACHHPLLLVRFLSPRTRKRETRDRKDWSLRP